MTFVEIEKEKLLLLPVVLNSLGIHRKQSPVRRPEGFGYHQFLWVVSGSCTFRIGGESFILTEGEGIFTKKDVPHSYSGEELYTSWFSFLMADSVFEHFAIGDYLRFTVPSFLERETEQLLGFACGDSTPAGRSAAAYSYIVELFSAIRSEKERLSDKLRRRLEQAYAEPLSLLDLADSFGTDRFLLCRIYKKERGVTIMEDLTHIRIKKAKQFLKYGVAPIGEIGKLCGFESPGYFGKRFREEVGCTPTEYRIRHNEKAR